MARGAVSSDKPANGEMRVLGGLRRESACAWGTEAGEHASMLARYSLKVYFGTGRRKGLQPPGRRPQPAMASDNFLEARKQ